MLVCVLLIPMLIRYASYLGMQDLPDERKIHSSAIPRVGGLAMVCGALLSTLIWIEHSIAIYCYMLSVIIIAIFGIWDDKVQLNHKVKFIGQLFAALLVVTLGDVNINSLPFIYDGIIPDYISMPFTIFALLGITNAINLSDGLDGLAGGSSIFSLGVIALIAYTSGELQLVMLSFAVVGAVLGFLRFNTYPASVFMGDTGSQFLGFSLGVLVIWLSQNYVPVMSPSIAIVALGVPILDTFYVMSQRLLNRQSPFKPDKRHIHHKLLNSGLDHYEAVSSIYLIQSIFVVSAYLFRFQNDYIVLGLYTIFGLSLIFILEMYSKNKKLSDKKHSDSFFSRLLSRQENRSQLSRFCVGIAAMLMSVYFFLVVLSSDTIPIEVIFISVGLIAFNLILFLNRKSTFIKSILRIDLYLISTVITYLIMINAEMSSSFEQLLSIVFAILIIVTILGFVFPEKKRLTITPLDYIIIFIMILISILPGDIFFDVTHYATDITRLFILFYVTELILMSVTKLVTYLKVTTMLSVITLLIRFVV